MPGRRRTGLAWLWAASIVAVWLLVALRLGQPVWHQQQSQALVAFGAFKGMSLTAAAAWRLIAAQWLHVNVAHMLLNAAIIGMVGAAVERRFGRVVMAAGLGGGALAQLIGALADPGGFVSGASPAALVLCGTAVVALRRSVSWWMACGSTLVAFALDVFVSAAAGPKAAHVAAFAIGCAAGLVVRRRRQRQIAIDGSGVAI